MTRLIHRGLALACAFVVTSTALVAPGMSQVEPAPPPPGQVTPDPWPRTLTVRGAKYSLLVQPFVNYNLGDGWYIKSSPIITANWKNDSGHQWTVPVGAGVGKLFKLGKLPINTSLEGFYNAEKTSGNAPDWQLQFQVQFLLPKF